MKFLRDRKLVFLYLILASLLYFSFDYFDSNDDRTQKVISIVNYDKDKTAKEMEETVTYPLEHDLSQLKDYSEMQSETLDRYSVIKLLYNNDVNLDDQIIKIKKYLSPNSSNMLREYFKHDIAQQPALIIEFKLKTKEVNRDKEKEKLSEIVDSLFIPTLKQHKQVARLIPCNFGKKIPSNILINNEKNKDYYFPYFHRREKFVIDKKEKNHIFINDNLQFMISPEFNLKKNRILMGDKYTSFKIVRDKILYSNDLYLYFDSDKVSFLQKLFKKPYVIEPTVYLMIFKESDCSYNDFYHSVQKQMSLIDYKKAGIKNRIIYKSYLPLKSQIKTIYLVFLFLFGIMSFLKYRNKTYRILFLLFIIYNLGVFLTLHFNLSIQYNIILYGYFIINCLLFLTLLFLRPSGNNIEQDQEKVKRSMNKAQMLLIKFCLLLIPVIIVYPLMFKIHNNIIHIANEDTYLQNRIFHSGNFYRWFDVMLKKSAPLEEEPNRFPLYNINDTNMISFENNQKWFDRYNANIPSVQLDLISDNYTDLNWISQDIIINNWNEKLFYIEAPLIMDYVKMKIQPNYPKIFQSFDPPLVCFSNSINWSDPYSHILLNEYIVDIGHFRKPLVKHYNSNILVNEVVGALPPITLKEIDNATYSILYNSNEGVKWKKVLLKDYAKVRFAGELIRENNHFLGPLSIERGYGCVRRYYHINQKRTARHNILLSTLMKDNDYQVLKEKLSDIQTKYSKYLKVNVKYPFESIKRINIQYSLLFLFGIYLLLLLFMNTQYQIMANIINLFYMISIIFANYYINNKDFSSLFLFTVFLIMAANSLFMLILSNKKISDFLNTHFSRIHIFQFSSIVIIMPFIIYFNLYTFSPGLLLIMSLIVYDLLIVSLFAILFYLIKSIRKKKNDFNEIKVNADPHQFQ